MREIKFRAWDKDVNQMLYDGDYSKRHSNNYSVQITNKGIEYWTKLLNPSDAEIYDENGRRGYTDWEDHKVITEEIEIMQYTGLKDKNGKEIYEGDILATSNSNKDFDIWDKNVHGYTSVFINYEHGLELDYTDWAVSFNQDSIYDIEFVEVIGNIYENPEILKGDEK